MASSLETKTEEKLHFFCPKLDQNLVKIQTRNLS